MEISSVLAGSYNKPDYIPATSNINQASSVDSTTSTSDADSVDPRRYSQFDRTASKVADADMSFGDFLDMINPLQHIPVVSSVYRAITGDKINPVSRIAGDTLYGGVFGVASAALAGVGAIANSMVEAHTGKDVAGTMIAGLFGDDETKAGDSTGTTALAANTAATPAAPSDTANAAATTATTTPAVSATLASAAPPFNPLRNPQLANMKPLVRNNLPYGGAMAPTAPTTPTVPNYHDENLKMSMANATAGIRVGNSVYASRMKDTPMQPTPSAPAAKVATTDGTTASDSTAAPAAPNPSAQGPVISALPATPVPATASATTAATAQVAATPVPQGLQNDAMILKALESYRNVAARSGETIN